MDKIETIRCGCKVVFELPSREAILGINYNPVTGEVTYRTESGVSTLNID